MLDSENHQAYSKLWLRQDRHAKGFLLLHKRLAKKLASLQEAIGAKDMAKILSMAVELKEHCEGIYTQFLDLEKRIYDRSAQLADTSERHAENARRMAGAYEAGVARIHAERDPEDEQIMDRLCEMLEKDLRDEDPEFCSKSLGAPA